MSSAGVLSRGFDVSSEALLQASTVGLLLPPFAPGDSSPDARSWLSLATLECSVTLDSVEVPTLLLFFELTPDSFSGSVVTGSGAPLSSETAVCLSSVGSSDFCSEEANPFGVLYVGLPSCPSFSDFEDS